METKLAMAFTRGRENESPEIEIVPSNYRWAEPNEKQVVIRVGSGEIRITWSTLHVILDKCLGEKGLV